MHSIINVVKIKYTVMGWKGSQVSENEKYT